MPKISNREEFINKAINVHSHKFNYSLVEYVNSKIKVIIACPKHGEFMQRPNDHLTGYGCKMCQYEKTSKENRGNIKEFIGKSTIMHGKKYNYSRVEYVDRNTKVKIMCPKHGEFKQTPSNHLYGYGCKKCSSSHGEIIIENALIKNKINYLTQVSFPGLFGESGLLYYDFYLPDHRIMIEYDGIQHTHPIEFFGGKEALLKRKKYDLIKIRFAVNNGYKLLKLPYRVFNYLEEELIYHLNKIL